MKKVFIDGQAGTTGLQIYSRLKCRDDIELIEIDHARRKDVAARKEAINNADVVILCLPDEAAKESVLLIESPHVRVLDASSAHRVTAGWVYGLPEISLAQRQEIAEAKRVSNPGCYPTGAILLLNPLVTSGLLDTDYPYSINAISGYTGGGRDAIERFEDPSRSDYLSNPYRRYALHHEHKHVKEMAQYNGLTKKPVFQPAYGLYRQGILLQIPIHLSDHSLELTGDILREKLNDHYADSSFVTVLNKSETLSIDGLSPDIHNDSNDVTLGVFTPDGTDHAVLTASYDNLGKGASGAAVQNLEIMLNLVQSDGHVSALD